MYGCHDAIPYTPNNAGLTLLFELVETLANDGQLSEFHAKPDPWSGEDGLDEVVVSAALLLDEEDT